MIFLMLIVLIIINVKQDVLDGRAAAGIEPGTFSPAFSGEPGRRTTPRLPGKILRLGQFPKNLRKLSGVEKQQFPKFSAKWIQHKIHVPRFSGNFMGSRSKNPQNLSKIDSSKKPKKKAKDVFLPSPWGLLTLTCFWDPKALLNFLVHFYVIILNIMFIYINIYTFI